jgi:hypothetical protein
MRHCVHIIDFGDILVTHDIWDRWFPNTAATVLVQNQNVNTNFGIASEFEVSYHTTNYSNHLFHSER